MPTCPLIRGRYAPAARCFGVDVGRSCGVGGYADAGVGAGGQIMMYAEILDFHKTGTGEEVDGGVAVGESGAGGELSASC